ncbi:MAG: CocE/NonD family hydrolase [Actinomycetota bacterium]|nr:CocE/NonD family hydrolase [Actinomycetota bacterium]
MQLRPIKARILVGMTVLGTVAASVIFTSPSAVAAPNAYVTMSDGISIAINVRMPDGYEKGRRYPAVFEMSGYDGGSSDGTTPGNAAGEGSRGLTKIFNRDYVTVHASVRGTGCSGGEFDLFSWRSAQDGRELVEWMAQQEWSNGDVGIYGHSYGGITGFMVAATRPPHLRAVSVSGLIDDLYRGIAYPGGVSNYGFPLLWTGAVRPVYDVGGGTFPGLANGDAQCVENLSTRGRTVLNDPLVQGLQDTDNTWFQARSLINYVERIDVPIHITGAYQDEQTGPRGPTHLWEAVSGVSKRLVITNGDHGTNTGPEEVWKDRRAWMDRWVRGAGANYPRTSVTTFFDMVEGRAGTRLDSRTFPLESTDWTDLFLRADGALSTKAPAKDEGSDLYISGSPRQAWSYQAGHTAGSPLTTADGPDQLSYSTPKLENPLAIVGPATATLYASSTAPDTELFVEVIDEAPDGSRYYIQRGMLKVSHRAILEGLSDKTRTGEIYRPWRPHTNPTLIEPGKVYRYLVEIFPFGHVFRPGHKLIVQIHTPPAADSYYAYVPKRPVGVNTVFHTAENPSRVMLPVVPVKAATLGPEPKPCSLEAVRCTP